MRGEAQMLPNGGVFAGWSERGYSSEFSPDGRCVLEARFVGDRFNTYRAYKFDFVGTPAEPPVLTTHAYGSEASLASMSSVFSVSWNGATEVSSWTFYGSNDLSKRFQEVGRISRSGFETTYISDRFWAFSYAQANAVNGTSLGRSAVGEIILPNGQAQNITLAGLSIDGQLRKHRPTAVATIIVLVGLVLSIWISRSLFFWKRSRSCWQSLHKSELKPDGAIEAGEMEALKYDDESDIESGD
jgi:hypothetical protein